MKLLLAATVSDPLTVVAPLSETAPVPVLKVPVPVWLKFLPLAIVTSPLRDTAPVPVPKVPVPFWTKLLLAEIVTFPLNVDAPVTVRVPPRVVFPAWSIVNLGAALTFRETRFPL